MSLKIFAEFLPIKNGPLLDIFFSVCRLARKEEKTTKTEAIS
jgi:hypothetical protein